MDVKDILSIILGSSLLTTVIGFFLHRRTERISAEINSRFEHHINKLNQDLEWKKLCCKTLGDIYFHLHRTGIAFPRYKKSKTINSFLEEEVLFASNSKIRDIILTNGAYIPPELTKDANDLVAHVDVWLEKYNSMRTNGKSEELYVIVGPDGYRFPMGAEERFKACYLKLWRDLYDHENELISL